MKVRFTWSDQEFDRQFRAQGLGMSQFDEVFQTLLGLGVGPTMTIEVDTVTKTATILYEGQAGLKPSPFRTMGYLPCAPGSRP